MESALAVPRKIKYQVLADVELDHSNAPAASQEQQQQQQPLPPADAQWKAISPLLIVISSSSLDRLVACCRNAGTTYFNTTSCLQVACELMK